MQQQQTSHLLFFWSACVSIASARYQMVADLHRHDRDAQGAVASSREGVSWGESLLFGPDHHVGPILEILRGVGSVRSQSCRSPSSRLATLQQARWLCAGNRWCLPRNLCRSRRTDGSDLQQHAALWFGRSDPTRSRDGRAGHGSPSFGGAERGSCSGRCEWRTTSLVVTCGRDEYVGQRWEDVSSVPSLCYCT